MLNLLIPYKYKKYATIVGCLLIHLSLSSYYTFGNISPYIISYMRNVDNLSYRYSDSIWILTSLGVCLSLGTIISGVLISFLKFKIKLVIAIGSMLTAVASLATFFTLKSSYMLTVLTYGILNGIIDSFNQKSKF